MHWKKFKKGKHPKLLLLIRQRLVRNTHEYKLPMQSYTYFKKLLLNTSSNHTRPGQEVHFYFNKQNKKKLKQISLSPQTISIIHLTKMNRISIHLSPRVFKQKQWIHFRTYVIPVPDISNSRWMQERSDSGL